MTSRPVYYDTHILSAAYMYFEDEVEKWCNKNNHCYESNDEKIVKSIFVLRVDGFAVAQELSRNFNWIPNTEIVNIFEKAYNYAKNITPGFVREWVMKEGVRLNAKKGNNILVRHKGQNVNAIIIDTLDTEARCFAEIINTSELVSVFAEEIVKVVSRGDGRMKPTPVDPNSGGSPMAMAVAA